MLERLGIFLINIFCPPLSVLLVAGPDVDFIINCFLFVAGVIPSHVHAFYITCTYFHRKSKVKKGRHPGGRRGGIYSGRVLRGGLDRRDDLVLSKEEMKKGKRPW